MQWDSTHIPEHDSKNSVAVMPIKLTLRRQRQEHLCKFEDRMVYTVRIREESPLLALN